MIGSKRSRDALVVGLLTLFVLAAAVVAQNSAKPTSDELLRMIPAESLFCVRANNFNHTLGQIDQFLTGIAPMPMWLSMVVRGNLVKVLGSPELDGVNMNGNFAIFGIVADSKAQVPEPGNFLGGVLLPVTDYKQFIDGNPNLSPPDTNGVSKNTSKEFDGMLIKQIGNYALMSKAEYSTFATIAKSISVTEARGLAGTLDSDEVKQATTEPIWAYGNAQLAAKTFGPLLLSKIEKTKATMENIESDMQKRIDELEQMKKRLVNTDPDNKAAIEKVDKMIEKMKKTNEQLSRQRASQTFANVMDMYAAILELLMKETKSLVVTAAPKPNVLNITSAILAMPGTEMADLLTADTTAKKENKLLCYLEDGAVMNVSGQVTGELNAKAMDFFATIMTKDMSDEDAAKIKSLASDFVAVFSGNDAMSFSVDPNNKPVFVVKYVIEMGDTDKDKFYEVIEEGAELFNTGGIADFYKSLGMETSITIKRDVDSYKGISIDSTKVVIKSTEPNSPQGQMINAMYGEGFDYRWAMVDGLWVCIAGGDVNSAIRSLIDLVKVGGPKQMASEMKAAVALIPQSEKADFVGTYNFLRLFKIMGAMMPMPAPMPQMDISTKSNIAFAGNIGQGKMTLEVALPKEHLMEMMGMFQQMQQQQRPTIEANEVSAMKLRAIGKTCLIYANDYGDKFPPNLRELVEKEELSLKTLESPRKPKDFDGLSYIYISGQTIEMNPGNILVYENPAFCSDMINVLFLDTHVEAVKPDKFLRELKATYKRLGKEMPEVKFKDSTETY